MEELKPLDNNDTDLIDIAISLFGNIVYARQTGEYEKFEAHLSEAMRQGLTRQKFDVAGKDQLNQLDGVKGTAYLGRLWKKECTHTLKKARYEKDNQGLFVAVAPGQEWQRGEMGWPRALPVGLNRLRTRISHALPIHYPHGWVGKGRLTKEEHRRSSGIAILCSARNRVTRRHSFLRAKSSGSGASVAQPMRDLR